MTDGELLEQAAKAIGLKYIKPAEGYSGEFGLIAGKETLRSATDRCGATTWNPLADDGDALRLAVQLGLQIVHYSVTSKGPDRVNAGRSGSPIPYGDDPFATTRRAITRAAAEIGKAK